MKNNTFTASKDDNKKKYNERSGDSSDSSPAKPVIQFSRRSSTPDSPVTNSSDSDSETTGTPGTDFSRRSSPSNYPDSKNTGVRHPTQFSRRTVPSSKIKPGAAESLGKTSQRSK